MRNLFKWFTGLILLVFASLAVAGVGGYAGDTNLGIFANVKCSTGMTCTKVGNKLNMVSSPTLAGSTTLTAANAADIALTLQADNSDDSGDDWKILAAASGNALNISNDTSGSHVTKLSISTTGVLSLSDSETITNASDIVSIGFDDAAANVRLVAFEATNSNLILQADESDDNGDDWMLSSVASDDSFTISNDTSGSQVAKFTMSTAGAVTLVGSVTGDGGDALSGFLQAKVATTTASITAAQCGSSFVSDSADVMALPEASTVIGCRLTFIAGTADDLDINPADGTDQILPITASGGTISPAAGDAIRITDAGASVTLEAIGNDAWAAVSHNGAITDVN